MKATFVLSLLSIIGGSLATYGGKKCNNHEIKCESNFGRSANGDGTNTYSFACKCKIQYDSDSAEPYCKNVGQNISNNCSSGKSFLPASNLSFQINDCNLNNATTTVETNGGNPKKVFISLSKCTPQGVAGLNCVGSSKF
ncbi:hypothetical protein K502DRAFT_365621 [Neoconidiobolus thromboides FSU 785]|nr:hypothetical protein K502DRAFT_365621 [Neoconidiobolus thromboides FSU 785]